MAEGKHTLGRHTYGPRNNAVRMDTVIRDSTGRVIADLRIDTSLGKGETVSDRLKEERANGELFAAAPETKAERDKLLAACRKGLAMLDWAKKKYEGKWSVDASDTYRDMRAAIAKAEKRE